MKKEETTGKIGERLFKELLIENKIPFIDLQRAYIIKNKQKFYSHPFDFILNDLNIEIKTSKLNNNNICFSWCKNDNKIIDYVIGIVLDKNNNIDFFLVFDNEYINTHKGYRSLLKYIKKDKLDKKDIISLSTGKGLTMIK